MDYKDLDEDDLILTHMGKVNDVCDLARELLVLKDKMEQIHIKLSNANDDLKEIEHEFAVRDAMALSLDHVKN